VNTIRNEGCSENSNSRLSRRARTRTYPNGLLGWLCGLARDECIYSNRLVGGIVIILMFMCKNRNELGKYPV